MAQLEVEIPCPPFLVIYLQIDLFKSLLHARVFLYTHRHLGWLFTPSATDVTQHAYCDPIISLCSDRLQRPVTRHLRTQLLHITLRRAIPHVV